MDEDYLIERICSFVRVGTDPETACIAAGVKKEDADELIKIHQREISRAAAQFVVLSCNRIMSEGGASGAKYLLQQSKAAKDFLNKTDKQSRSDGFDFDLDFNL